MQRGRRGEDMIAASKLVHSGVKPTKPPAAKGYVQFITPLGPPPSTGKEQRDPNSSTAALNANKVEPFNSVNQKATPNQNLPDAIRTFSRMKPSAPGSSPSPRLPPPPSALHSPFSFPPKQPSSAPMVGMTNNGNTCYINSVLQALFNLPTFSRDLMDPDLAKIMGGPSMAANKNSGKASSSSGDVNSISAVGSREVELWTALKGSLCELQSRALASTSCPPLHLPLSLPFSSFLRPQGPTINPRQVKQAMTRTAPLPSEAEERGPASLVTRWGTWRQQDAHEFLIAALDRLQGEVLAAQLRSRSLNRSTPSQSTSTPLEPSSSRDADKAKRLPTVAISSALCPGAKSFSGCLQHSLKCKACGHCSLIKESINHISLQLPPPTIATRPSTSPSPYDFFSKRDDNDYDGDRSGAHDRVTIGQLLKQYFEDEEVDKVCDQCKTSSAHVVSHKFRRTPEVLIIHLKRFQHELLSGGRSVYVKLHTRVEVGGEGGVAGREGEKASLQLRQFCLLGGKEEEEAPPKAEDVEGLGLRREGEGEGEGEGGKRGGGGRGGGGQIIALDDDSDREEEATRLQRFKRGGARGLGQGAGGGGGGLKGGAGSPPHKHQTSRIKAMGLKAMDARGFGYLGDGEGGGAAVKAPTNLHRATQAASQMLGKGVKAAPLKKRMVGRNSPPPAKVEYDVHRLQIVHDNNNVGEWRHGSSQRQIDLTGSMSPGRSGGKRLRDDEEEELQRAIAASLEDEEGNAKRATATAVATGSLSDGYNADDGSEELRTRRRRRMTKEAAGDRDEVNEEEASMVDEIELSQDPPTHPMVGPLSDPRDRHAVSKPQALLLSTDEKAKNEKVRLESASKERMAEEAARYLPQVVLVEDSDADGEDEEDKGQGEGEGEGEGKAGPRTKASPKPGLDPKDSCAYELRGAILHRGSSPQSGHYVSLMSIASDRTWWCFNDEQVERVSIKRVLNEISSEGYILFYSKS